jgi:CheY-like chemotaxis protein
MSDRPIEDPQDEAADVPDEFTALVRDALAHLYDYAHLQRHPLAALVGPAGPNHDVARALRNLLLDTLEQLEPGAQVSRNDKEWRPYGILTRRYIDGFEIDDIVAELRTSLRQFQRDHRKGLLAMASILWPRWQANQREGDHGEGPPEEYGGLQREMERLGLAVQRLELGALLDTVLPPAKAMAREYNVWLSIALRDGATTVWADPALAKQAVLASITALIAGCPPTLEVSSCVSPDQATLVLRPQPPLSHDQPLLLGEVHGRLADVDELMAAQGGRLEVRSETQRVEAVELHFRRAEGISVLIVDDNERVLQLFERYLVPEGYRVTAVADGHQALEAADRERPAVIVLDVMMRTIDGWELLQRLRADAALSDVPIIVCSVLNEPELAFALGARHYLKKPVSQQQMLAAMREVLLVQPSSERHPAGHGYSDPTRHG